MEAGSLVEAEGKDLIFLISQPRSGSTLLQRMLGAHPDVHTVSEPWLMLPPLSVLRAGSQSAEYDANLARQALTGFLEELPGGIGEYYEGVRQMYSYLYRSALDGSGKRWFLDKTPRYYHIIPEIHRTFPAASFIILLRNPLAVLCSVLAASVQGYWLNLHQSKSDLLEAPDLLLSGIQILGERVAVVHYEKLVGDPANVMTRICSRLGLVFSPNVLHYGREGPLTWPFGDQKTVHQLTEPDPAMATAWQSMLQDSQVWRLTHDYLQWLGKERVEAMGYPYAVLKKLVAAHQPGRVRLASTYSLSWLLAKGKHDRAVWVRGLVWAREQIRTRGMLGALSELPQEVRRALSEFE
jgi:hypothetical protein